MIPTMKRPKTAIAVALVALLFAADQSFAQAEANRPPNSSDNGGDNGGANIAASPEQIRPLLLGDTIPSVTVADIEGTSLNLRDVVSGQPTILIFYRGGW
jgi:hypothetical protein